MGRVDFPSQAGDVCGDDWRIRSLFSLHVKINVVYVRKQASKFTLYVRIYCRVQNLRLGGVGSLLVDLRVAVSFEVRLVRLLRGRLAT